MRALILFVLVLVAAPIMGQEAAPLEMEGTLLGARITFEEETHDFGDIYQGDKLEYVYVFENSGTEPLILSNVLTTCGCTATDWPHDPIAPGKSGEINVTFDSSGKMGKQNKVITVVSNAINSQERIKLITNVFPVSK